MKRGGDIHAHCAELRERSARLRVKVAMLRIEYRRINDQIAMQSETVPESGGAVYDVPPIKPYDQAMETLHAMRAMLDALPLEWQIAVVKALTARTILKAHERTHAPPTTALSA
jgi:hypothetical protein